MRWFNIKKKVWRWFRLSLWRLWKDPNWNKRYNAPHSYSVRHRHRMYQYSHTYTRNECCSLSVSLENFHIFIVGLRKHFLYVCNLFDYFNKSRKYFANKQHSVETSYKNGIIYMVTSNFTLWLQPIKILFFCYYVT